MYVPSETHDRTQNLEPLSPIINTALQGVMSLGRSMVIDTESRLVG